MKYMVPVSGWVSVPAADSADLASRIARDLMNETLEVVLFEARLDSFNVGEPQPDDEVGEVDLLDDADQPDVDEDIDEVDLEPDDEDRRWEWEREQDPRD